MNKLTVNSYDQEGIQNTEETLDIARERANELGIDQIVVATTTGQTALATAKKMPEMKTVVGVTMHAIDKDIYVDRHGEKVKGKDPEIMQEAREAGVRFYTGVHPFRGALSNSLSDQFGGYGAQDIIAITLRELFSTGTKVAIECAVMAADGGLIDVSKDIIALGGYRGGVDTALVLKPSFSYRLFETRVREIIAFPRSKSEC